jgi:hypothetical protein
VLPFLPSAFKFLRRITLILLVLQSVCGFTVHAQKHTTIYTNPADTGGYGGSQRIIISYYTPASQQNLDEFQQLVSSYLNLYIDKCAVLENGDIKLKKSKRETLRDLNGIVVGALDFY